MTLTPRTSLRQWLEDVKEMRAETIKGLAAACSLVETTFFSSSDQREQEQSRIEMLTNAFQELKEGHHAVQVMISSSSDERTHVEEVLELFYPETTEVFRALRDSFAPIETFIQELLEILEKSQMEGGEISDEDTEFFKRYPQVLACLEHSQNVLDDLCYYVAPHDNHARVDMQCPQLQFSTTTSNVLSPNEVITISVSSSFEGPKYLRLINRKMRTDTRTFPVQNDQVVFGMATLWPQRTEWVVELLYKTERDSYKIPLGVTIIEEQGESS